MVTAAYLRDLAEQCRRLASTCVDAEQSRELLSLAIELTTHADELHNRNNILPQIDITNILPKITS
jgi:hypothetical protein